jgi:hypothetical protein
LAGALALALVVAAPFELAVFVEPHALTTTADAANRQIAR